MPATILIVDDSATMRALVRTALEADAHVAVEAVNGAAALAMLAHTAVDLVITDVLMPEMDGLSLTRALRADARFRAVPILVLTTEATTAVMQYGFGPLGLNRIHAYHFKRNPASGRVLQKSGLAYEGRLRKHVLKDDRFEDLEIYGALSTEWVKPGPRR